MRDVEELAWISKCNMFTELTTIDWYMMCKINGLHPMLRMLIQFDETELILYSNKTVYVTIIKEEERCISPTLK